MDSTLIAALITAAVSFFGLAVAVPTLFTHYARVWYAVTIGFAMMYMSFGMGYTVGFYAGANAADPAKVVHSGLGGVIPFGGMVPLVLYVIASVIASVKEAQDERNKR